MQIPAAIGLGTNLQSCLRWMGWNLDIPASVVARGARSVRTQKVWEALYCRVINDAAVRLASHADVKLIVDTRFAGVAGPQRKINVTELVCSGVSADKPRTNRLAIGVGAVAAVVENLISRNRGPMGIQARAMVVILEVTPSWRTVLASAGYSKVGFGSVMHDPATAGEEITWRVGPSFHGDGFDQRQRCRQ